MNYIDKLLNGITMYRLVLYETMVLALFGIGFTFAGVLPFNGMRLVLSLVIVGVSCVVANTIFGKLFAVPVNAESSYITAFILFLIMPAPKDTLSVLILVLVSIVAMASKYVLNIRGKHVFNPAALAVWLIGITGLGVATWWVASGVMLVPAIIGGLFIARKLRRLDLFVVFAVVALCTIVVSGLWYGSGFFDTVKQAFVSWPIIFFGSIMLTEPLTAPPTKPLILAYGAIVGLLFGTSFHIGPFTTSPEFALLVGNLFSYIVSPKGKLILTLKEKIQMAPLVYDFVFTPNYAFNFTAGQYMAWTLTNAKDDSRGNRRFFTVASSPTEKEVHLGVKIPPNPSAFKQTLLTMEAGSQLVAGQLAGDFTLARYGFKKYVAIAGGIGITPFRSMIKQFVDTGVSVDMVLFYASADVDEFVYNDVLTAGESVGIKTVRILSGAKVVPSDWHGPTGYLTKELIEQEVSNPLDRIYFISGPNVMVDSYKKLLVGMGVQRTNIVTDYFPGY